MGPDLNNLSSPQKSIAPPPVEPPSQNVTTSVNEQPSITIQPSPPPLQNRMITFLKETKYKTPIIVGLVIIVGIIIFLATIFIKKGLISGGKNGVNVRSQYIPATPGDYSHFMDDVMNATPLPEDVERGCNSPLAPPGTTPYDNCNYRDAKISITEAQGVMSRIYNVFGVVQIPSDLNLHEEVYKNIHIKWSDNQPISATTMGWLKNAIDILPPYFYQDHPAQAIYSVTLEDLKTPESALAMRGVIAYASGLNIFISKELAEGKSTQYVINQEIATQTLFHEWTHVTQFYNTLQTYTEKYLSSLPGISGVVMRIDPIAKNYAKTAGWVFSNDEFGDGIVATLGTDAESQKQTDYGKTQYVEDMAEAGSYFMLCQNEKISEARIKWWEQTTGTSRNTYCPSKI